MSREPFHCQAGVRHESNYFAGACDGIMGRATPDIHNEDGMSVAPSNKGKLTILFVRNNSSANGMKSVDISNVWRTDAETFIEEVQKNQSKCAILARVTVANESGSCISVKTGDIFMVMFDIYERS